MKTEDSVVLSLFMKDNGSCDSLKPPSSRIERYSALKVPKDQKMLIYKQHKIDLREDFVRPPHDMTTEAVISKLSDKRKFSIQKIKTADLVLLSLVMRDTCNGRCDIPDAAY